MPLRGLFVTGTDTGVGKTVLSAALVAALRAQGVDAIGLKPVVTGTDDPPDAVWPPDHELLAVVSGATPEAVNFARFGPPVSPHLAGELSGHPVDGPALRHAVARAGSGHEAVIVEGVGGLLVPLSDSDDVAGLAAGLGLPLVVVARPGLGTINHTLLTLEAARARGLEVLAVVLNQWPDEPGPIERSNRATIARLGEVEVSTFPTLTDPLPERLAAAGADLDPGRWLDGREASARAPMAARNAAQPVGESQPK